MTLFKVIKKNTPVIKIILLIINDQCQIVCKGKTCFRCSGVSCHLMGGGIFIIINITVKEKTRQKNVLSHKKCSRCWTWLQQISYISSHSYICLYTYLNNMLFILPYTKNPSAVFPDWYNVHNTSGEEIWLQWVITCMHL